MIFEMLPTIDIMLELYQKPRNFERFKDYLELLQGDTKADIAFPISGFNPMAKDHVTQKLIEIKKLHGEKIIEQTLKELNIKFSNHPNKDIFKVALNLSDDLAGAWTNRYISDYDSKFKISAITKRKFCTPVFWTTEFYTQELIKSTTLQYALRTVYCLTNPKSKTLEDHIKQEKFVAKNTGQSQEENQAIDFTTIDRFYNQHKNSDDYHLIFNFLYGDMASKSLEFPCYGIAEKMTGYRYAALSLQ